MYKENNPKKKNIKALFLLMILTGFGFVVFKFTKVNEILADATEETEATSCPSDVVDNSYESDETFLYLDDSGNLTDVTPDVLGTTSSGECKIGANSYFGESACSLESDIHSSFDLAGWIDDDANITLTKITAPIRLLSGIFSVKDSNGDITKENPYYPPSGGIIKAKLVEIKTAPGEIHEEVVDETINNAVRKQAYSAQYTLTVADQPDDATLTINQYSSNDCGEACDNEANNNPDRSNKSSKFLNDVSYFYPGQKEEEQDPSNVLHIEGKCEHTDTMNSIGIKVCQNSYAMLAGRLGNLFPSTNWGSCNSGEEGCISTADIAVKISPMFDEANSYTEMRNKTAMDPISARNYETVYVITSCEANVSVNGGMPKAIPVKCIWDMSYLFNLRKSAEFDDAGGSETPTVEEYKKFLESESSTRTDAIYSM